LAARVRALRETGLGVAEARAAARELVAYAAIRDALARGSDLADLPSPGSQAHAA
jgi:hypothetical protein